MRILVWRITSLHQAHDTRHMRGGSGAEEEPRHVADDRLEEAGRCRLIDDAHARRGVASPSRVVSALTRWRTTATRSAVAVAVAIAIAARADAEPVRIGRLR